MYEFVYVAQAILELQILLPHPLTYRDSRMNRHTPFQSYYISLEI